VLAVGQGYVVETTNGTERVWLTNGSEIQNQSLDTLFKAGMDQLADPQVLFDPSSLRWFIAVVDLHNDQIMFGATTSGDPTGSWNLQHFNAGPGVLPTDLRLAVDATALVVTVDIFRFTGGFQGAEVFAANKTNLVAGMGVQEVTVDSPQPSIEALLPAAPLNDTNTLYLVDDGVGANNTLRLFSLTGAPPGTVTLSAATNFTTTTVEPVNAVQLGSSNLLNVSDGRLQSAAWRAGTLWAAANGGCTPSGDTQVRSCLHLWQLDTATSTLEQDFVWSTGVGTYDFDPALSITPRGDVVVAFEESSAHLYPSIRTTEQAVNDPTGTLETPGTLHNGTGPVDPSSGCLGGVCPFGSVSSVAVNPSSESHFWAVGEYCVRNCTVDIWRTWVDGLAVVSTVPVTFTETELPAGTAWSVTVNGIVYNATTPSFSLAEPNGTYVFSVLSPIAVATGVEYAASPSAGSFRANATAIAVNVTYLREYELTTSVVPLHAGSVFPANGWYSANASLSLSALAAPGYAFTSWSGSGPGAFSGAADPANLTLGGPISEVANFWASVTYLVSLTETGLPVGTSWTATVNGVSNTSTGTSIEFNEPNGSYSYAVTSPLAGAAGVQYSLNPSSGTFTVAGAGVTRSAAFSPEYLLVASAAPSGAGVVTPSGGWYPAGATVNLSAFAGPGVQFVGWSGTGIGSYTGPSDPAVIVLGAPVDEVADFAPASTYPVTFDAVGLPSGAAWTISVNGVPSGSHDPTVVFNEPNGSYTFSVQTSATDANGSVLIATPSSGTLTVAGAPIHQTIQFGPATSGTGPGPSTTSTTTTGVPVWAFIAAMVVALLAVALVAAWSMRRSRPPSAASAPPTEAAGASSTEPPDSVWREDP
jgi:Divergent InlB B-repeat domain